LLLPYLFCTGVSLLGFTFDFQLSTFNL
jgi:hypothetical protein